MDGLDHLSVARRADEPFGARVLPGSKHRLVPGQLQKSAQPVDLGREVRPPFGVYATIAEVNGKRCGSVTNVGYRPTFVPPNPGDKPDLLIETHLFDFSGDLYNQIMEVHFIEKLRDERRFPDVQALVEQIKKDEAKARMILTAHGITPA